MPHDLRYIVKIDGHPIILDTDGSVRESVGSVAPIYPSVQGFLNEWSKHKEGTSENPAYASDSLDKVGEGRVGLSVPNYPLPPEIGLNELYWPTGAGRWAFGRFLYDVDQTFLTNPTAFAEGTKVDFTVEQSPIGSETSTVILDIDLYVYSAKRIFSPVEGQDHDLLLLTLVDDRYRWQNLPFGVGPLSTVPEPEVPAATWTVLFTLVAAALELQVEYDLEDPAYLKPDPDEFYRPNVSVAAVFDAMVHSLGRIVEFDGLKASVSDDILSRKRTIDHLDENIVLGGLTQIAAPEKLVVSFPRVNMLHMDSAVYSKTITMVYDENGSALVQPNTKKIIFSSALADYRNDPVVPHNQTELDDLAQKIAVDLAAKYDYRYDITKLGLMADGEPITRPTDDAVIYSFGDPGKIGDVQRRTVYHRAWSPPPNFGVSQMLHANERWIEPFKMFRGTPQDLEPQGNSIFPPSDRTGGAGIQGDPTAPFVALHRDEPDDSLTLNADTDRVFVVDDTMDRNLIFPNEPVQVAQVTKDGGMYFEVIGENGLFRVARIEAGGIDIGQDGVGVIFSRGFVEGGDLENTGLSINVSNEHGWSRIPGDAFALVRYVPQDRRWYAISGEYTVEEELYGWFIDAEDQHEPGNDPQQVLSGDTVQFQAKVLELDKPYFDVRIDSAGQGGEHIIVYVWHWDEIDGHEGGKFLVLVSNSSTEAEWTLGQTSFVIKHEGLPTADVITRFEDDAEDPDTLEFFTEDFGLDKSPGDKILAIDQILDPADGASIRHLLDFSKVTGWDTDGNVLTAHGPLGMASFDAPASPPPVPTIKLTTPDGYSANSYLTKMFNWTVEDSSGIPDFDWLNSDSTKAEKIEMDTEGWRMFRVICSGNNLTQMELVRVRASDTIFHTVELGATSAASATDELIDLSVVYYVYVGDQFIIRNAGTAAPTWDLSATVWEISKYIA